MLQSNTASVSSGRCGRRTPRWWLLAVAAAIVLAVGAGPVDRFGETRSLTVHTLQHMVLFSAIPVLTLVALRPVLARAMRPVSASLAAVLMAAGVVVVWAAYVPPVMEATLRWPVVNDMSHLALVLAGFAMAWPLAAPAPLLGMTAVGYLVVAELAVGVLGMWLTWSPDLLYDGYAAASGALGLDPKTDQSVAGAVLLTVEEPVLAIEVAVLFIAALRQSDEDEDRAAEEWDRLG